MSDQNINEVNENINQDTPEKPEGPIMTETTTVIKEEPQSKPAEKSKPTQKTAVPKSRPSRTKHKVNPAATVKEKSVSVLKTGSEEEISMIQKVQQQATSSQQIKVNSMNIVYSPLFIDSALQVEKSLVEALNQVNVISVSEKKFGRRINMRVPLENGSMYESAEHNGENFRKNIFDPLKSVHSFLNAVTWTRQVVLNFIQAINQVDNLKDEDAVKAHKAMIASEEYKELMAAYKEFASYGRILYNLITKEKFSAEERASCREVFTYMVADATRMGGNFNLFIIEDQELSSADILSIKLKKENIISPEKAELVLVENTYAMFAEMHNIAVGYTLDSMSIIKPIGGNIKVNEDFDKFVEVLKGYDLFNAETFVAMNNVAKNYIEAIYRNATQEELDEVTALRKVWKKTFVAYGIVTKNGNIPGEEEITSEKLKNRKHKTMLQKVTGFANDMVYDVFSATKILLIETPVELVTIKPKTYARKAELTRQAAATALAPNMFRAIFA